jgi:hypothetical protein
MIVELKHKFQTLLYSIMIFVFIFNPDILIFELFLILSVLYLFIYSKLYLRLHEIQISILLILIASFGYFQSVVNNITQANHLLSVAKFIVFYFLIKLFLCEYFKSRNNIELLKVVFWSVVFNSLFIMLSIFSSEFHAFVESLHSGIKFDNVDYFTEPFRKRGLARVSGASLSILNSVAVLIGYNLLRLRYSSISYSSISVILGILVISFATLFVGRSGLILIAVISVLYFLFSLRNNLLFTLVKISLIFSLMIYFVPKIESLFFNNFGDGWFKYSVGFLVDGKEGLREEGTSTTIVGYTVDYPFTINSFLIGTGFYGGFNGNILWTDSGFTRSILSVGIFLAILQYLLVCALFFKNARNGSIFLILGVIIILVFAEIKESMVFSSYLSRALTILLLGLQHKHKTLNEFTKVY